MRAGTETFYADGKRWLPDWLLKPPVAIDIEGEIDDVLIDRVCGQLRAARFSPISTTWNSRGGQAQAGIRLYQALRRHPTSIKGHVGPGASCSSAAAIAFVGCDERSAHTTARFVLHRGAYEGMGGRESAELLRVRLALLDGVNDVMAAIIARRCGFRLQEVLALAGDEVTFTLLGGLARLGAPADVKRNPKPPPDDASRRCEIQRCAASFVTFEERIRDHLSRMLGPAGFDPARDITAIMINRWPHGYAYEYNPLFDADWPKGQAPHELGRARFGPIAIANSDAAAAAYTDAAIDQAHRAVQELLAG